MELCKNDSKDYTVTVKIKDNAGNKEEIAQKTDKNGGQAYTPLASTGSVAGLSALIASILGVLGIALTRRKKEL